MYQLGTLVSECFSRILIFNDAIKLVLQEGHRVFKFASSLVHPEIISSSYAMQLHAGHCVHEQRAISEENLDEK